MAGGAPASLPRGPQKTEGSRGAQGSEGREKADVGTGARTGVDLGIRRVRDCWTAPRKTALSLELPSRYRSREPCSSMGAIGMTHAACMVP